MTPIRSFVAAPEPRSDLRDEVLLGVVAGALARAERALAVWDLLVGAAGEGADGAPCPRRGAVPVSGTDRAPGVAAIVA